jgi:LacI family transcriptional regulator
VATSTPKPRDGRRNTIRDVAAAAGVSAGTVSRVLTGNYPVAPATRARIMRAVRDLDYVVNAHARALAGARTKTIGILLHDISSPFFNYIARGVERQAAEHGRLCLVVGTLGEPERELAAVELMREQHADAVILIGGVVPGPDYLTRMARLAGALDTAGSKMILCGRPGLGDDIPAYTVDYDNEGGAYAATSYLLSAGHRRILHLAGPAEHTTAVMRERGYRRALAAHRVPYDPALITIGGLNKPSGYRLAKDRLATGRDFTAVFADSDQMAAGALVAIREAGLRVPDDLSVIGYDDVPLATDVTPNLTTVHVPHDELGRTAARIALGQPGSGGPPASRRIVLGTHVVVRDSVRELAPDRA